jgi:Arc/MetJ family transcription regulator
MMRITVDIDAKQLASIQKETGSRKKSRAVRCAVDSYLDGVARRRLLRKILEGGTDYTLTNDEVEALGTYDAH